ncbi:hypothetical protein HHK36_014596 [Tetracentron sinense]|uniref:DNA2/NAM7 helicase helicase domain-containing protein n=1 Tax=Tetracentron sinense TaxID=13715 RepID=A0A834Z5V0_TETSI|nr:hypothetical protein HHK36_014596 [Tetracentron sinense]
MEMASVKKRKPEDTNLIDLVFSWSLEDVFNEELYKHKVENIPESFQSVQHYLGSYIVPLMEETRAELASSVDIISMAPFAEVISLEESKPYGSFFYDVEVDSWRNRSGAGRKELYKPLPGDIIVLADVKPESVSDLQRSGSTWTFGSVTKIPQDEHSPSDSKVAEDDDMPTSFKIKTSKAIEVGKGMQNSLFAVFVMNITRNKRIWSALHMLGNLRIIKEILCTDYRVEEICTLCSTVQSNGIWAERFGARLSSMLNDSQTEAVLDSISTMQCKHKSSVKLIWGPPGTGKTKTVSTLLWTLLRMNCRTLICAPTNVAITEVASRVKRIKESFLMDHRKDNSFCYLGDLLLFGIKDRLKVAADLEDIYLDYRVDRLVECFGPLSGWKPCFTSMIDFLEECVPHYHVFLENESSKEKENSVEDDTSKEGGISFLEFIRN